MIVMRLYFSIFTVLLPIVLAAKEVPGEELPANDVSLLLKNDDPDADQTSVGDGNVVKRSISEIAARRRSALDRSFMRFGRSDPSISGPRVKLGGKSLMRFGRSKSDDFHRSERGRPQDFMRFGRSAGNMMRFGRAPNLMRFGRAGNNMMRFGRGGNNMMRFGRGGNNMMRFGRGGNNMMRFGRGGNNMMRFGRGGNNMMRFGRGGNNMMRFGRSDDDFLNYENEAEFDFDDLIDNDTEMPPTISSDSYVREERSVNANKKTKPSTYADRQNDNFMRMRRSLLEKNYDDIEENENENPEQYINAALNNERLNRLQKNKLFIGQDSIDNPEEIQDSLDLIFPEESRRKRSLLKVDLSSKSAAESPQEHPDISSVPLKKCSS